MCFGLFLLHSHDKLNLNPIMSLFSSGNKTNIQLNAHLISHTVTGLPSGSSLGSKLCLAVFYFNPFIIQKPLTLFNTSRPFVATLRTWKILLEYFWVHWELLRICNFKSVWISNMFCIAEHIRLDHLAL